MGIQEERLQALLEAEKKILHSQEYRADGVFNRRAELAQVRKAIDDMLSAGVGGNSASRSRSRKVVLRDY